MPKTTASPSPVPTDLDAACQALQEIKQHLKAIASVGGAGPMAGLLLAAVDDCGDAVIVTNNAAEIHMVNGATARLTGLSTRELQSLTVWDITHPNSQGDFDVLWREFLRAGRQRGHYTFRNREGGAVEVAYCSEANVLPQRHVSVLRRSAGGAAKALT